MALSKMYIFKFVLLLQRGSTALHIAAIHGRSDIVEVLLENGAKINLKSKVSCGLILFTRQHLHCFTNCELILLLYFSPHSGACRKIDRGVAYRGIFWRSRVGPQTGLVQGGPVCITIPVMVFQVLIGLTRY